MAYGLKYYKELTQPNGKVVRLEILENDYEGASKEIGPVCQALRLDIQGDTEIDAPIVKTSLSMTFVDAPDHADARTKKCGNWDEFYTSDATLWQVVLKARNAQETAFTTIWGGYITPDSYTEVLQYRGSVTLVARDNIGHLSDFPFDAEGNADGMISLIELIREAWDKIESPMTLDDQAVVNADWMLSEGVYAYDTYMNVSAFEDMNWYDALESALYAYGLVLRYTGNNNVSFYSLRNLPRMGAHEVEDISLIEPTFMSGAERELTPAVKRIEEVVEYKIESAIQPQVKHEDFTLNRDYYAYDYGSVSGKLETGIVEAISNTDKTKGWANEADKTLFFDPNAYELSEYAKVQPYAETLKKSMYIAVNNVKNASLDNIDRFVTYGKTMRCQDFAYVFNLGMLIQWSGSGRIDRVDGYSLSGMTYAVSMERLGITYYYAGEGRWQTSYKELNLELAGGDANNSVEIPIGIGQYGSSDPANFVIYIKRISYTRQGDEASGRGLYVAIQSLEIALPQTSPIFAKNNVNTAYDNTNNVILSRDPKIAPALNTVSLPALIQNGIFIKRGEIYDSAKTWYWGGQTPQQMAVYNHLQLLCYHAKPNNILRGTIVNADVTDMQVIWMWHGAEHMLVSGTLDLISGYIENAVLREFARYEDMWGMLEPSDMPEVEGKSSTNVEGGVASSSEGARMTSTTTVNIGGGGGSIVLDTFMSDTSQNGVQNRVIKAYVDDACSDLDTRIKDKADNTTVTALGVRVSANEEAIDALDKRVTAEEGVTTTYASWWADLKKYIKVEGGNVKIDTNLIIAGDTSSGGSGSDTPASGTVTGIKVSSTQTLTPNSSGIIDMVSVLSSIDVSDQLKDYAKLTDIPTTMAWTAISGKPSFATVATSGKYSDLSGLPTIPTVPTKLSQFTDDVVSGKYLPLSGGTIGSASGGSFPLDIISANAYTGISFYTSGGRAYFRYQGGSTWGVTDNGWNNSYTLIHSGNIGSYAFVPKSDDLISNVNADHYWSSGAYLNQTGNGGGNSNFPQGYAMFLSFSNGSPNYVTQLDLGRGNAYYRTKIDTWSEWKQFITSDNIGNQTVAAARKLVTSGGTNLVYSDSSSYFVAGLHDYSTYIDGKTIYLRYAASSIGMVMNSSGNVGIGTTGPQYKLDVNGALGMGGIEILDKKSNALYIGYGSTLKSELPTYLWGKGISFINSGGQIKMSLTDGGDLSVSGKVSIGSRGAYIADFYGFICLQSVANELLIGANGYDNIHINYRPSADGTAPKTYYWRAGSSASWADFWMGNTNIQGNLVVSGDIAAA